MPDKRSVKAECADCSATGLYRGFMERPGEAVVCLRCKGTGCVDLTYTPFTERHPMKGMKGNDRVRRSAGTFIGTGVGPHGEGITYAEFRSGKMPA